METVVLVPAGAPTRVRHALDRACDRLAADIETVETDDRGERLHAVAARPGVRTIVVLDDDAVLLPAAFGGLTRTLAEGPAVVGGRAMVHGAQRFGWMFGAPRSGPDPFELVPVTGFSVDRHLLDALHGPLDVPQRGVLVVDAAFIRALDRAPLDPFVLHLELAVHARDRGRAVWCDPALGFSAQDDPAAVVGRLATLRRFAAGRSWDPETMHRDPAGLRARFIHRETRAGGNIRGYLRRPWPPIVTIARDDVAGLRRALAATGDRYVLVADPQAAPTRSEVIALVERLERSGRRAVALASAEPPYRTALFHGGRPISGSLDGADVDALIGAAIAQLPHDRLFAASPAGDIVPAALPPPAPLGCIDTVFLAAAKPEATNQTVRPFVADPAGGSTTVVYPAGNATTTRALSVFAGLTLAPDADDPQLAVCLNRVLGESTADAVLIVRDDAQVPRGVVARLRDAFARVPRLGAVVPRVSGIDRPEGISDVGYASLTELQTISDRRGVDFARETTLMDVATAPVILVSRRALATVGGFDETFGFTRYGVADLSRRLRAANFLIARCDDAYVHVFPPGTANSLLADLDDAPALRAAYEQRWAARTDFDPDRDRVPFVRVASSSSSSSSSSPPPPTLARLLVAVASAEEWARVRPHVAAFAAAFRASDPVEVAIGLDGDLPLGRVVGAVRDDLIGTGIALADTLNVRIDRVPDLAAWRDSAGPTYRLAGVERAALATLPAIDSVDALRAAMSVAVG